MRPLGFESLTERLRRSVVVGLVVGVPAMAFVAALVVFARSSSSTFSALPAAASAFGLGFFAGFVLAFIRMEFAPPQPKDDGDAEAGVPARLVPPVPTLSARIAAEAHPKNA